MPYHTRNRSVTNASSPSALVPPKDSSPVFPPLGLKLHPDDENSKVLVAIGKALLSVNNCAMTVKDLADAALRHGLVCTGSSPINAASQQITSYIRLHQRRCEEGATKPLLKSYTLAGTCEDDRVTDALYSRAGGSATRRGGAVDTAFRKGTLVWYLSTEAGAEDPFQRAGIKLPGCRKRRRQVKSVNSSSESEEEKRPKIKLKIKLGPFLSSAYNVPAPSPLPAPGSLESVPIVLDSPLSSPGSSCSLPLPPYPIESHTRYLRDIPNSPFDLPEYASPPPDSEDDHDDFHTSMMAVVDDSDGEYMGPSLKYEQDSDVGGSDGRRSRSTSWTTATDPKTPRDVDRMLDHPTLKVEGRDEILGGEAEVKSIPSHWNTSSPPPDAGVFCKQEETASDWNEPWMTQDDLADLMSFEKPLLMNVFPPLDVKHEEDFENDAGPSHVFGVSKSRSFSAPVYAWHDGSLETIGGPSHVPAIRFEEDEDIQILGPDTVPPEEFDQCLWQCRGLDTTAATISNCVPRRSLRPPAINSAGTKLPRYSIVNGIRICELNVDGHTLRRRIDNSTVHLRSLLRLISNKSPASDFLHLDGASHVKNGELKGTWVPLAFARELTQNRNIPQDLVSFLEDPVRVPRTSAIALVREVHSPSSHSLSGGVESDTRGSDQDPPSPIPTLLPPITLRNSPRPSHARTLPSLSMPPCPKTTARRSWSACADSPMWQRDGFTDWKVNSDFELTMGNVPFPQLPSTTKTSLQSEQASLHNSDFPLSPQEEEIFRSLVDLAMGKPVERFVDEEDVLEADDEEEDQARLRRSKRVAARTGTARTRRQLGTRRSTRTK